MKPHEQFKHRELREVIFGYEPEYSDRYDLAIFLRRTVILSAALARAYYVTKRNNKENMMSRTIDRIVERPYISIDNSVSMLTALQGAGEKLDRLGLSALKILSDETNPDFINLYEVKAVLQDEAGKFFDVATCREMLNKVITCVQFITSADIKTDEDKSWFVLDGESFDVSDLFKYEFCYLYRALQEVDPLTTTFIPL